MKQWIIAIGLQILQGLAQSIWDSFWYELFDAVVFAEKKWEASGRGEVKKKYAVDYIMQWLESRGLVKWYKKRFMRRAVEAIVDRVIEEANKKAGHNWIDRAEDLKSFLASKIPFIK